MSDLYRDIILEHWRHPQNKGVLSVATHKAFESNPLCGDEIGVTMRILDGVVEDVRFEGRGCAISIAAISLLTEAVKGRTINEVRALSKRDMLRLLSVTPGPARMKCALLGLRAVQGALTV